MELTSYLLGKKSGGGGGEPSGLEPLVLKNVEYETDLSSYTVYVDIGDYETSQLTQDYVSQEYTTESQNYVQICEFAPDENNYIYYRLVIANGDAIKYMAGMNSANIYYPNGSNCTINDNHIYILYEKVEDECVMVVVSDLTMNKFYGDIEIPKQCTIFNPSSLVLDDYLIGNCLKAIKLSDSYWEKLAGNPTDDYFNSEIDNKKVVGLIKKLPNNIVVSGSTLLNAFNGCSSLTELPLLDTTYVTNMGGMCQDCTSLTKVPLLDTSGVGNLSDTFNGCTSLVEVPQFNTASATAMTRMFMNCTSLTTIPVFDTTNVINMISFVSNCKNLSDETLDNILQMCINATDYQYTKTLNSLSVNSSKYPASKIQTLPHYQDFIDAGWTIGY